MTERWPWRVRFAHWVLGLISPWLALTPYEEPDEAEYGPSDDDLRAELHEAYMEGRADAECDERERDWQP